MNSQRWQLIKDIFEEVLATNEPDRAVVLRKLCGNDEELQVEVEKLIGSYTRMGNFLEPPPSDKDLKPHNPNGTESEKHERPE